MDDLSARLFVKLYTSLLDDEDMVERSYAAIGVYVVGMLISKHTAVDGDVPMKLLHKDAALRPGTPLEEGLEELAAAGLITIGEGYATIRSWSKYNALVADIVADKHAKAERATRAAHERWHKGEFDDCPRCHRGVSPAQSPSDAPSMQDACGPDATGNAKSQSKSKSKSHSKSDSDPAALQPASDELGLDPRDVAAADGLIEILGYFGEPSTSGERRYVARARLRGWTIEHLQDLAHEAASKTDVDDVRQWLGGCLRKRANTDPGPAATKAKAADGIDPLANIAADEAFPDPDEGWDTPEITKGGLAAARAALPRNKPSPSKQEATEP